MPKSSALRALPRWVALALVGTALAGCSTMKPTQKAFAPDEYDVRHPIKLAHEPRHIDIFVGAAKLDRRQHQDIVEFARDYVRNGQGPMTAALPQGPAGHHAMGQIRQALVEGGASGGVQVAPYSADASAGAAPVRLTFVKLQAKVASQCGLWPKDLAGGADLDTWQNRPFHNLGCSYQTMLAAQIADPVDLVRPRAEGAIDVGKRIKDIEAIRKGEDPATKWAKDDVKVKEAQ